MSTRTTLKKEEPIMSRILAALALTIAVATAAQADTIRTITMDSQNVTVHGIWDAR